MRHKLPDTRLLLCYLIVGLLFVVLKLGHSAAETGDLFFLLKPVASLVSLFSGAPYVYLPAEGFYYESLNIVIDKSCSGFNFGCLCFLTLCFPAFRYITGKKARCFVIPALLVLTYGFTVLVNTSRILLAILINKCIYVWNVIPPKWLHVAEGVFVYLFSLILIYIVFEFVLLKTIRPHEKLA